MFRVSPQKLAMLAKQITGLPLEAAMIQMQFSPKKSAHNIFALLSNVRANLLLKKQNTEKYVVQQALVGRGPYIKKIDIKGRGRHGIIRHPHAFIRILLTIPNERKELTKLVQVKRFPKENKPIMCRLDY